ncbi:MAG TPA: carbohydrate ABC transporter permease [Chloroflexota bacterium]|nr:carbohydrate ABC transporter permease [Chloroflexota bacterium]
MIESVSLDKGASARKVTYQRFRTFQRALALAILFPGAALFLFPAFWMLIASFEPVSQILQFPPSFIPDPLSLDGYTKGLTSMPFGLYFQNTAEIALLSSLGGVISSSLAGFAFARLRAPGRDALFLLVLSTLMLPYAVVMIPQYLVYKYLGWIDTYLPLIVPAYFGLPFLIFLFRQFFATIPEEVFEAARIDGCGYPRLYVWIGLPLSTPVIATAFIFHFQFAWNDFLAPLIYLNSDEKLTLSLALAAFQSSCNCTQWNQFMAASLVVSTVPILIFFFGQRYLMSGIVVSAK